MKPPLDRFQPPTAAEQQGGLETYECRNCGEEFVPDREHQKLCKLCEKEKHEEKSDE